MLSKIIRILILAVLIGAPSFAQAFDPDVECDPEKWLDFEKLGANEVQAYFNQSYFSQNAKCDDAKCVLCFASDYHFGWQSSSPLVIQNFSEKQLVVYNLKLNFQNSSSLKAIQIFGNNVVLEKLSITGSAQQDALEVIGDGHKINNSSIGSEATPFAKGILLGSTRVAANNFEINQTSIFADNNLIVLNNAKGISFADELQVPMNLNFAINSLSPVVIGQNDFGVVCSQIADGKLGEVDIKYCPSDESGANKFNVLAGIMPAGIKTGQVKVYQIAQSLNGYYDVLNESMVCPVSAIAEPFYMTNNSVVRAVEACAECYKFECPAVAENAFQNSAAYFMVYEGLSKDDAVLDQNGSNFFLYVPTSKSVISVIGAASIPGTVSDATGGAGFIEIGGGNAIETDVPIDTAPDGTPLIIDTGSAQAKAAAKGAEQKIGQGSSGGCGGQQSLSGSKSAGMTAMIVGMLAIGGLPALIPVRIRAKRKHK